MRFTLLIEVSISLCPDNIGSSTHLEKLIQVLSYLEASMGRNMVFKPVVSSSTLETHLRLFSHLLTFFYISLFNTSMLNPTLMHLTYGFYVCSILFLCPDVHRTSFAPFQICMFLTDHWQIVCTHSVPIAISHLIFSHSCKHLYHILYFGF